MKKLALLLCLMLVLAGCSTAPSKYTSQIFAMDTVMDLTVYGDHQASLQDASALVFSLEEKLSATRADSEIGLLNENKQADLSEDTGALLEKALEFCEKTEGNLDISVYPLVKAWGFPSGNYQIPDQQTLQSLSALVSWENVRYSPETGSATLEKDMEIDLGSVAKGWTGDQILSLFRDQGVTSALLNLGGNVQALGAKPDGSPFQIGVQDPEGEGYLGVLRIRDEAVITSGGYQRYFKGEDGEIYWHIIDPATGRPARTGLLSATAIGPEGAYCDALSTALFIMGPKKAQDFWRQQGDFQMILITDDHQVLITPDLENRFSLTNDQDYTRKVISHD